MRTVVGTTEVHELPASIAQGPYPSPCRSLRT